MTALVIREWDNPKEKDRLKKYYTPTEPTYQNVLKKFKVKYSVWTQGVGHMTMLEDFENLDEFAKAWSDEEYNKIWTLTMRTVDNATCRVLRTSMQLPPE